jgi:hypothetical protein
VGLLVPPCCREMPSIEKLFKAVDKNKVAFVMLSIDDNFDKAKAMLQRKAGKHPSIGSDCTGSDAGRFKK